MSNKKLAKLESIRGMAALYVVFHHINQLYPFKWNYLNYLFRFGQEAVILFFLMSGFVIYYSIFSKENQLRDFKSYFVKRFKRIYPLFIIALLLSYITSCMYSGKILPPQSEILIGNLLNLQDFSAGKPGVWVDPYYGNLPLWSLSYEWWFYMIFWIIIKISITRQFIGVLAISMVGFISYSIFPNSASLILTYLIVWWTGAELAKLYLIKGFIRYKDIGPILIGLSIVSLMLLIPVIRYPGSLQIGLHPVLELRHFLGSIFFIVIAITWQHFKFLGFDLIFGIFSRIAPISFGIYIFHYPLVKGISYLPINFPIYIKILIVLLFVGGFSYLMEMKFQKYINQLGIRTAKVKMSNS
ncbi:MAG: acyltransferase [Sporocytophaga sp.]|uniref:acyltransferase family protein n=1 Tax=Sporocytophaga sp. TaxID=2231183 RepID=UPI001B20DF4B|nr:acyltransferase [Sporocytophaga sp.]MBO9699679.1 acyltransferase [Sporocytophaga sp.]